MLLGSLCTGYGGLDLAVSVVTGAELVWVADIDKDVSSLLACRYPEVPNLGDISAVDWAEVQPVDILSAGFPCQDISCAGKRAGIKPGNRSGVWEHAAEAISALRPGLVVIENVQGILSARADSDVEPCEVCLGKAGDRPLRALGAVLGVLSGLGYDAEWRTVSAAEAGSCHLRKRVFIIAWPAEDAHGPAGG